MSREEMYPSSYFAMKQKWVKPLRVLTYVGAPCTEGAYLPVKGADLAAAPLRPRLLKRTGPRWIHFFCLHRWTPSTPSVTGCISSSTFAPG